MLCNFFALHHRCLVTGVNKFEDDVALKNFESISLKLIFLDQWIMSTADDQNFSAHHWRPIVFLGTFALVGQSFSNAPPVLMLLGDWAISDRRHKCVDESFMVVYLMIDRSLDGYVRMRLGEDDWSISLKVDLGFNWIH